MAHVLPGKVLLALYPGGRFLISEMNAYDSGGRGRVSFHYARSGPGVAVIYWAR